MDSPVIKWYIIFKNIKLHSIADVKNKTEFLEKSSSAFMIFVAFFSIFV